MEYKDNRKLIIFCPICGKTFYSKFANELNFYENSALEGEPIFSKNLTEFADIYGEFTPLIECPECSKDGLSIEFFNVSAYGTDDGDLGEVLAEFARYHHTCNPKCGVVECDFGDDYTEDRKVWIRCDDWDTAYSILNAYILSYKNLEDNTSNDYTWELKNDGISMKVNHNGLEISIEFEFNSGIRNSAISEFIRTLRSNYESFMIMEKRDRKYNIDEAYN